MDSIPADRGVLYNRANSPKQSPAFSIFLFFPLIFTLQDPYSKNFIIIKVIQALYAWLYILGRNSEINHPDWRLFCLLLFRSRAFSLQLVS